MRNLFIALLLMPLITYCNISTDEKKSSDATPAYGAVNFMGHCAKYLKVHVPVTTKRIDKAEDTKEASSKSEASKDLITDEKLLYVAYSISEDTNGERKVNCWLSDGGREYKNDATIKGGQAYLSRNYCDIQYDLDGSPTFGTFTFEYSSDWAWIHYEDEESGYKFDTKFRNSECIALSL